MADELQWEPVTHDDLQWEPVEAPKDTAARAVKTTAPAAKDYAIDFAKGVGQGLGRGVAGIPGLPGDAIDLINAGRNWWNGTPGAPHSNPLPNSEDILKFAGADKWLPQPETGLGKAASNVASFLPGAVTGPIGGASRAANVVRYGVVPGLLSEGAGQAADQLLPEHSTAARVVGGLAGLLGGRKITSPNLNEAPNAGIRNDAVATLRGEGVEPHPGDVAGSKSLTYLYDELNPERYNQTKADFTRAAMRRGGVDDLATFGDGGTVPQVQRQASQQFEDAIRAAPGVTMDRPFVQEAVDRLNHISKPGLFKAEDQEPIRGAIQRMHDLFSANGGVIPPNEYQALRSDLGEQARSATDTRVGRLLHQTVDSLDDAMERSIGRSGGDTGMFQNARDAWRRYLTLREAADDASGYITPARLQNAIKKIYGEREVENNRTPFSDLSRAGDLVLGEAKSSGTAERAAAKSWLDAPAHVAGIIAGGHLGNGAGAENIGGLTGALSGERVGGLLSPAVRPLERAVLDNPVMRRYLGNQLAGRSSDILSVPGLLSAAGILDDKRKEPLRITVHPDGG
jgi:hypothetical protein